MGCGGTKAAGADCPAGGDPEGLRSDDLEVVRASLHRALSRGAKNAETQAAEQRLRDDLGLPADWNMQVWSGGRRLEGAVGGRQGATVIAYEPQPASVVTEFQALFDGTYRKVYTRDRRGAPMADRFVIKEVTRVLNDQVWREYAKHRDDIRARLQGQRPAVPSNSETARLVKEKQLQRLPPLDDEVNEHFLFHGTSKAAAEGIAENDFRLDLSGSNAGTLYGKGIYLAENATKSDEYGEGPRGPSEGGAHNCEAPAGYEAPRPPPGPPPQLFRESYMLLCRSCLGKMLYTDERRPNPDQLQKSCLSGGQYNSVIGDRRKTNGTYREIVVYSDDHVYPEFVVKYERIFFHERFAQIYNAMLQRQRRGQFRGPTREEEEVLRSMWNVYAMPNKGKINKWQLLDLLMAICQPPQNEGEDLDDTFRQWDTKRDGVIDYDEFIQEMTQRVRDGITCSGAECFKDMFQEMVTRRDEGRFTGIEIGERAVMQSIWYTYAKNSRTIDKMQLLEILKAIGQPPQNEREDLDATFREWDTKRDGVIDFDEFVQEIEQRVKDE